MASLPVWRLAPLPQSAVYIVSQGCQFSNKKNNQPLELAPRDTSKLISFHRKPFKKLTLSQRKPFIWIILDPYETALFYSVHDNFIRKENNI